MTYIEADQNYDGNFDMNQPYDEGTTITKPLDESMYIDKDQNLIYIWCSCELVVHVVDASTGMELREVDTEEVEQHSWSMDGLLELIASLKAVDWHDDPYHDFRLV